jgi:hypothetical protein
LIYRQLETVVGGKILKDLGERMTQLEDEMKKNREEDNKEKNKYNDMQKTDRGRRRYDGERREYRSNREYGIHRRDNIETIITTDIGGDMIRVIEEMITEFTRSATEMKEKLNIKITEREKINIGIDTDMIKTKDYTMKEKETYKIQMKDSHVIVETMTEENIDIQETTDMIDIMTRKTYKNRDKQYYREKRETQRTKESITSEKRMDLNLKASLSWGQIGGMVDDIISKKTKSYDRIFGNNNVGDINIEGNTTKGIIETGSMVTTMSIDFYNSLVNKPTLHSLDQFNLQVNAANGEIVPYLGYIETRMKVPFIKDKSFEVPVLVVPMTENNITLPVIIGTNFIRICGSEIENNQHTDLPEAWNMAI